MVRRRLSFLPGRLHVLRTGNDWSGNSKDTYFENPRSEDGTRDYEFRKYADDDDNSL